MEMTVGPIGPKHYVGIKARVTPADMGSKLAELLPAVSRFLRERGVAPASAPTTFYHAHHDQLGVFEIQAGMFVAEAMAGEGLVEPGVIEHTEAVRCMHVGPYEGLGETHEAVEAWLQASGRTSASPSWESYLSDPGEVPQAELKTEVVFPLLPLP